MTELERKTITFEEPAGTFYKADLELYWLTEEYGADRDGRRGVKRTCVDTYDINFIDKMDLDGEISETWEEDYPEWMINKIEEEIYG